ncbi:MAG: hypothetical protein JXB29_04895 [Sedimentisphaerales bacterium]|nr:hypothetical protein [Sedimentisphaerales bacterium]
MYLLQFCKTVERMFYDKCIVVFNLVMSSKSPKQLMKEAMSLAMPERVPVMCQFAIGHTLLKSGLDSVDYFLSNDAYADGLLKMRELYNFDGVLIHKPGREPSFTEIVSSIDRDMEPPTIFLTDGSRIECTKNDDPHYRFAEGFDLPKLENINPDQPLSWAPDSFVRWSRHKGTAFYLDIDQIPEHWYRCIDIILEAVGEKYSVHGEVRSPFDHLLNIAGMEEGLMALMVCPDNTHRLMETFTKMSVVWAIAQVRRGCDAIKISSPYAGAGFISPKQYEQWIVPYERRIAEAVRAEGAFVYTHTCGAIGDRLDLMAETKIDGIETLDPPPLGTVELAQAKCQLKNRLFIKGNVDPVNTILNKTAAEARRDIEAVYAVGSKGGQYIMSTACSIPPAAPVENVKEMTNCVYEHAKSS